MINYWTFSKMNSLLCEALHRSLHGHRLSQVCPISVSLPSTKVFQSNPNNRFNQSHVQQTTLAPLISQPPFSSPTKISQKYWNAIVQFYQGSLSRFPLCKNLKPAQSQTLNNSHQNITEILKWYYTTLNKADLFTLVSNIDLFPSLSPFP